MLPTSAGVEPATEKGMDYLQGFKKSNNFRVSNLLTLFLFLHVNVISISKVLPRFCRHFAIYIVFFNLSPDVKKKVLLKLGRKPKVTQSARFSLISSYYISLCIIIFKPRLLYFNWHF